MTNHTHLLEQPDASLTPHPIYLALDNSAAARQARPRGRQRKHGGESGVGGEQSQLKL